MKRCKKMRTLVVITLIISNSTTVYSENKYHSLSAKVNSIFDRFSHSPGCVIGIIEKGKFVHKKGYGLANIEYDIPITSSTVFHMASVSKQFTGFAIHLLEKEGKLSLKDDIRKYLPEMPDYGCKITIDNLLHHTSGLRDQWELLIAAGWRMDDIITQKHILDILRMQRNLNFNPGVQFNYSNSNYTLLAEIVERVSGKSFTEYTKDKIFNPLGMKNTFFKDDNDIILKNGASSYRPDGKDLYKIDHLNFANVGATNLQTTLDDFAQWDRNFYTFEVGGKELIERFLTKGKLKNGEELSYASGIKVQDYKGMKALMHGGADAGYGSFYITIPERELSFILFANIGSIGNCISVFDILDLYLDDDKEDTSKINQSQYYATPIPASKINDYVGLYINGNNDIRRIIKRNNTLLFQFKDDYNIELTQISQGRLYSGRYKWIFAFQRNHENDIVQFTIDNSQKYSKLNNKKLSVNQINNYEGTYYCEEINTMKRIISEDGFLYIKGRNESSDPLFLKSDDSFYRTNSDEFYRKFSEIKFEKNHEGKVIGYYLNTPMVWNLYFQKVKKILVYE